MAEGKKLGEEQFAGVGFYIGATVSSRWVSVATPFVGAVLLIFVDYGLVTLLTK